MAQKKILLMQPIILTGNLDRCEDDCACAERALVLRFCGQPEFESDCACVDSSAALASIDKPLMLYLQTGDTHPTKLDENFWLAFSPYSSSGPNVLNQAAWERWCSFTVPQSPIWPFDQTLAKQGLIMPLHTQPTLTWDKPETLTSWLHLTDRCNLRCSYCYLSHVREDISPETGRAAVEATFRSAVKHGFQEVKLKYAGGEPMLRFPLIVELHKHARSLAEKNGLSLDEVVLSNGTLLTVEIVETLKSLGIRLMISLDGLGAFHDSQRSYASGRGSFFDVAEAVELALAHGLTPDISITVSGRTEEGLPELIAWVLERELPFSLNFFRENDFSTAHAGLALEEETILNGMTSAFRVIEANLPRRSLLASLMDRANLAAPHLRTCGAGQNYLVFDQRGQVAKCQMQIGKIIATVCDDDPLALVQADQSGIQNKPVEEKEGCRDCQWRYWCAGGCPLATYRATGRYDVQSPNCNIYRALFPEVLRLEGLRLLKYQDDPQVVQKLVL